jgi:hypothetical protein
MRCEKPEQNGRIDSEFPPFGISARFYKVIVRFVQGAGQTLAAFGFTREARSCLTQQRQGSRVTGIFLNHAFRGDHYAFVKTLREPLHLLVSATA